MIGPRLEFGNDAEIGAEEAASQLGNEFFAGALGLVPGVAAQIPANPLGPRRPVAVMPISA